MAPRSARPCTPTATASSTQTLPATGEALPPDWALQDPDDYREVLRHAVPAALADAGVAPEQVVGIGIDFTACTVLPTLADGTPLCEVSDLRGRPHAYVKLWKHHAAQPHADRINAAGPRAGRAVDRALRREDLGRVGSSPRGCNCSRKTPRSTGAPSA